MTAVKRVFFLLVASWISAIDVEAFGAFKHLADLRSAVWRCFSHGSPQGTGPSGPIPGGLDIHIQYWGGWGYARKSHRLKKRLEQAFDNKIYVQENKDIGVTGNFEVVVDGDLVWSKRTRNQGFPTTDQQVDTIIAHIKARQKVLIPPKTAPTEKAQVNIQYWGGWGYGRRSSQLRAQLEDVFNGQIQVTEYKDSGVTGNFEVVVNGDLIWSKQRGHGFPMSNEQVDVIINAIRARQHLPLTTQASAEIADVHIQYWGGWGYGRRSNELRAELDEAFGGELTIEEIKDPGITGNFEVVAFGDLVWSKATGQGFPTSKEQVETIIARIKARQHGNKNREFN